jgi:predicted RNA-binding protein YlqC (UPF0109 family)
MNSPDFSGLVRFLIEPFLDSPESLSIDCETLTGHSKVWIRVAFSADERGKVFGRGGRNIQAVRQVVQATAELSGWSANFEVYGAANHEAGSDEKGPARKRSHPHRPRSRQRNESSQADE